MAVGNVIKYFKHVIIILSDPFLPRIVELATTSSDRQTKVCTLNCSLALYIISVLSDIAFNALRNSNLNSSSCVEGNH